MTRLTRLLAVTAVVAAASGVALPAAFASDEDDMVMVTPRQDRSEIQADKDNEDSLIGPIHGSVGAMVGTGGARVFYGTVDIPIGENGMVSLSYGEGKNLPYSDVYPGYETYGHRYGWLAPFDTGWAGRTIRQRDGR